MFKVFLLLNFKHLESNNCSSFTKWAKIFFKIKSTLTTSIFFCFYQTTTFNQNCICTHCGKTLKRFFILKQRNSGWLTKIMISGASSITSPETSLLVWNMYTLFKYYAYFLYFKSCLWCKLLENFWTCCWRYLIIQVIKLQNDIFCNWKNLNMLSALNENF